MGGNGRGRGRGRATKMPHSKSANRRREGGTHTEMEAGRERDRHARFGEKIVQHATAKTSRGIHRHTHIDRDRMIRTSCNSLASMATVCRLCVCVFVCVSVPGDDVRKFMCMPQILCRFHGLHSQDWLRRQVEGAGSTRRDTLQTARQLDLDPEARQTHTERVRETCAGQNPFKPSFQ